MMMGFDSSFSGYLFMIIIWLLIIGLGIWLLATLFPKATGKSIAQSDGQNSDLNESALQILKQRYARGELSKDEYEETRHELEI